MDFKRGSSFLFVGQVRVNGQIENLSGWTFTCQIREKVKTPTLNVVGTLISDIPVTVLDAMIGSVQLGSDALDTTAWPLGAALIDVRAVSPGGTRVISDTTQINIVERVTHAP
jgi:hypothetical protein